jgi:hypothetical protein
MTSVLQGQTPISFIIPFMQMTLKVILDHFLFVFDYFGVVQPCSLALHVSTSHARPDALQCASQVAGSFSCVA